MKRLGVIGTFVWDVIHGRQPHSVPVEEWGGVTYSLSALDAALPRDWEIVPIMKIGSDLADRARQFIHGLQRIAADAALVEVPYPNNRVELRYFSDERRTEMLSGGVPGWTWLALTPLIEAARLDALYVNFLSGWEMDLDTAQALRRSFRGPMYADLHMLVMAVQADGLRVPRPLSNVREWCGCFDLIQANEDEIQMMAPDPLALAASASGTWSGSRWPLPARSGRSCFPRNASPTRSIRPAAAMSGAPPISPACSRVISWRTPSGPHTERPHATSSTGARLVSPTISGESSASRDDRHQPAPLPR
jgi:hypothetical protein